jgi:hypothetical protein
MPVYLKDSDDYQELEKFDSVLIVPCRFCPAASLAVKKEEPYFELFSQFMKTAAYENFIDQTRDSLIEKGVKADVFRSRLIHQFVICMWSTKRRQHLLKRAKHYDALLVMSCEAGVRTVYDAVKSTSCNVFMGMRSEGIMSVLPRFQRPGNILLDVKSITPLIHQAKDSEPWVSL